MGLNLRTWPRTLLAAVGALVAAPLAVSFTPSEPTSFLHIHPDIAPMSLPAYAKFSTDVVAGRVVERSIVKRAGRLPHTRYVLETSMSAKSVATGRVVVNVAGSDDPDQIVIVDGAPSFRVGDEVLLFLQSAAPEEGYGILGLDQGTYRVVTGANGVRAVRGLHARDVKVDEFVGRVVIEWARSLEQGK